MTSLSNIYRLSNMQTKQRKVISVKPIQNKHLNLNIEEDECDEEQIELKSMNLLKEAEEKLDLAKKQADQLLENTRKQINEDRKKAEQEINTLYETAKREGFEEGLKKGQQEANLLYEEKFNEIHSILEQTKADYKKKMIASEEDLLIISVKAAEAIVKHQLTAEPTTFLNIIKDALEEVIEQPNISIYVHPSNYEIVKNNCNELKNMITEKSNLYIYPKKDLQEHGCLIETDYGIINCSIDTKLEQLKKELLNLTKGQNDESE
ncbi:flagellar assembly protein FliH [Bacillaceae bacterium W0354]